MKNKSLFIVLMFVITGIIIAVALALRFGTIKRVFTNGLSAVKEDSKVVEMSVDEFKDISINANVMGLEIRRGDDYHVEYKYPDSLQPKVKVDDEKLDISIKGTNITLGNNFKKDEFKFIIYVPENATFGKLEGEIDAGDIRIANAVFDEIELETDAGNIEFDGLTVGDNTTLKADAGNIELRNCKFEDLNIDTDAGNVETSDITAEEVVVKTEMGNIELKKSNFKEGEFESSLGNIDVRGTFDSVRAECSLGAIAIYPDNDDAKIDAEVSLGSINISGKQYSGKHYNN